ncbi:hypothetical protein PF001_g21372 [Phytophthora fragariae]|uniref:RxLR effector protein n=3 Tax=Phytophthora fragariae TaxID=53985 RepID=A0A6A4C9Y2_9STRA|nr:hypothetical protein PF001_g21372 [Phytophthora fragariae]
MFRSLLLLLSICVCLVDRADLADRSLAQVRSSSSKKKYERWCAARARRHDQGQELRAKKLIEVQEPLVQGETIKLPLVLSEETKLPLMLSEETQLPLVLSETIKWLTVLGETIKLPLVLGEVNKLPLILSEETTAKS